MNAIPKHELGSVSTHWEFCDYMSLQRLQKTPVPQHPLLVSTKPEVAPQNYESQITQIVAEKTISIKLHRLN
jgi:hypothetical protein